MNKLFTNAGLGVAILTGTTLLMAANSQGTAGTIEQLGMHIYKDKNLSLYQNQSCQTCHHPSSGFADPANSFDPEESVVSIGSDGVSTGNRNAPSSAYAGFSPNLYKVVKKGNTNYFGGMFWDGRKDGSLLGDPLAEQAQGPPLNPVEMAMDSWEDVLEVIRTSSYYHLWSEVFGEEIAYPPSEEDWNNFARAVAAFERSEAVTKFTSKYDLAHAKFTDQELTGEALFEKHCASCHSTTTKGTFLNDIAPPKPLFTTYGYANIGVPANSLLFPAPTDYGLGPVVNDPNQYGKFKIPTLRNIADTAPYTHNGSFPTLEAMVSFINDNSQFTPEVPDNLVDSRVVGDLGLSENEINAIVAFLKTLSDN